VKERHLKDNARYDASTHTKESTNIIAFPTSTNFSRKEYMEISCTIQHVGPLMSNFPIPSLSSPSKHCHYINSHTSLYMHVFALLAP